MIFENVSHSERSNFYSGGHIESFNRHNNHIMKIPTKF